jgi:hypothetical protein
MLRHTGSLVVVENLSEDSGIIVREIVDGMGNV